MSTSIAATAIVSCWTMCFQKYGGRTRPLPMRNSQGAVVYYLCFASQKAVANQIVEQIFKKYESRGT